MKLLVVYNMYWWYAVLIDTIISKVYAKLHDIPFINVIFTVGSCTPVPGALIKSYATEKEMILAWAHFVRNTDPDILTGYNINNFDLWYIISRANRLNATDVLFLGRINGIKSCIRENAMKNVRTGERTNKLINVDGRLIFDVLLLLYRDYKFDSYTLDHVSIQILGKRKDDVHHSIISDLHNGNANTRQKLAIYCLKDAVLPLLILDKLDFIIKYIELSRASRFLISRLLVGAPQEHIVLKFLEKSQNNGHVLQRIRFVNTEEEDEDLVLSDIVVKPVCGYYQDPIIILEFVSDLYSSVIQAYNICSTTIIMPDLLNNFNKNNYISSPVGVHFLKPSVYRGILTTMCADIKLFIAFTKNEISKSSDPFQTRILSARLIALKKTEESIFLFTRTQMLQLDNSLSTDVRKSVQSFGRAVIQQVTSIIEAKFSILNGFENNAKVIYADNKTVVVWFGVRDAEVALKLGKEATRILGSNLARPICLEISRLYSKFLMAHQNMYAGLRSTKPLTVYKIECEGFNKFHDEKCSFAENVVNGCIELLLLNIDTDVSLTYVKSMITDLLANKIDIRQLVFRKILTKRDVEYVSTRFHAILTDKLKKRDHKTAPRIGDTVEYVIILADKPSRLCDRVEDPNFVIKNNIMIDAHYYIDKQLKVPLTSIFSTIFGDQAESLIFQHAVDK